MKKLSLVLILVLVSFCCYAQRPIQPVITKIGKFKQLLLTHAADTDTNIITMQAGDACNVRCYFRWNDKDGAQDWLMGKNAGSTFILFGSGGDMEVHRLQFVEDGGTDIASAGTAAVKINSSGDPNTGTGGFKVYSGGADPNVLFQATRPISYFLNTQLITKPDGSTNTVYFRAGDTLVYKPIEIYEGATDALIVYDGVGGNITFQVDTTNRRVGINKTPSEVFDVNGAAKISDSLVVDTSTLVVNATDYEDRVGIGTGSPNAVFHIKADIPGSVGSDPAGQLIIQNPTDTVFSNVVITAYESDGDGNPDQQLWYLGSASGGNSDITFLNRRNAKLTLGTSGTSRITILGNGNVIIGKALIATPDEITAVSGGTAASIATINTEVTTNDDDDLDNVTLANGTSGQIKHIYCVASFAGDTWKITPATMCGGTQITFGDNSVGNGCTLVYADNEGWVVTANNGGTIS